MKLEIGHKQTIREVKFQVLFHTHKYSNECFVVGAQRTFCLLFLFIDNIHPFTVSKFFVSKIKNNIHAFYVSKISLIIII